MGAEGFTYKLALKNGGEKKQNKTKTLIDDKTGGAGGFTYELTLKNLFDKTKNKIKMDNVEMNLEAFERSWSRFLPFWVKR